jgi:alkylation response protein AidB-like acyl-CoA dehydrogenase
MLIAANAEQKQRYFPKLTEDGKIMAYCMTEPDAGSDVAGIKTTAIRKGDRYILNGAKTWITDGPVASYFTVFAKTDPNARHKGMSCFIVEREWKPASAPASRWRSWVSTRRRRARSSSRMSKCPPKICWRVRATAL